MSRAQTFAAVLATIAGLAAIVVDHLSEDGDALLVAAIAGGVTVGFAVLLFAGILPRATARPRTAETAVVTSVIGFLSAASAWSGLPFVLGTGGAMLGGTARRRTSDPRQRGMALFAVAVGISAVALGCVTVALV